RLQDNWRARVKAHRASSYRRPVWLRFVLAAGLIVILLTLGGIGLVRASDMPLPSDGFWYSVRRTAERASLFFASAQARRGVLLHVAQARLSEISTLAS